MGLLDDLKAKAGKLDDLLEGKLDRWEDLAEDAMEKVKGEVKEFVNDPRFGGLHGLVDRMKSEGLEETVKSWVGKGENLAISPAEIVKAIGPERIRAAADRFGIPEEKVSAFLARVVPPVVDTLTPDGTLPPAPPPSAPAA
ncbi:MAG: YidB family protein [Gemmatimonadales bacterium]|nr:YidB family protein [Gemmatimonadales bacterium]